MGDASATPARRSWLTVNAVLVVVALLLVTASVLWFRDAADATPGDSRTQALSRDYRAVTRSATDETTAFLTVDHTDMDPLIARVLAGATGAFAQQYAAKRASLEASARSSRVVSSGTVLSVGISALDDRHAVALVAADSRVRNKSTRGQAQQRYYRLRLTLTHQGERWLTSELEFVG